MDVFSLLPLIDAGWDYNRGIPPPEQRVIILQPGQQQNLFGVNYPGWLVMVFCDIQGLQKTGDAKYVTIRFMRPFDFSISPAFAYQEGSLDLETYVITIMVYQVEEDHYTMFLICSPPLPFAKHMLPLLVEVFNPGKEPVRIFWNIVYISIYDVDAFKASLGRLLRELLGR